MSNKPAPAPYPYGAKKPPGEREAYPLREGAFLLGLSKASVYNLHSRGELKLIKLAGRTLVPRSEIERLTKIAAA